MMNSLVHKLRTAPANQRRVLAIELARTRSDEVTNELIKMVESGRRTWVSHHTADDQLIGVEALGETGDKEALDYLSKLYSTVDILHKVQSTMIYCGGHEPSSDVWMDVHCQIYRYPLAKGRLADLLRWEKHEPDANDEGAVFSFPIVRHFAAFVVCWL
jgi:hypothetical protein